MRYSDSFNTKKPDFCESDFFDCSTIPVDLSLVYFYYLTKLLNSMAMVTGPIPPGTGV